MYLGDIFLYFCPCEKDVHSLIETQPGNTAVDAADSLSRYAEEIELEVGEVNETGRVTKLSWNGSDSVLLLARKRENEAKD